MTEQPQWFCPKCGHVMTEEESKLYRSCPTGVHFVQHKKIESKSWWHDFWNAPKGQDGYSQI
jgi:hypothetical protein